MSKTAIRGMAGSSKILYLSWLGDQDSNLDSQIQSLMAYH